jgi:hypothetical protein
MKAIIKTPNTVGVRVTEEDYRMIEWLSKKKHNSMGGTFKAAAWREAEELGYQSDKQRL